MVNVGIQANTVDTQKVTLTNFTDSLTYAEATIVNFDIDSIVEKNQRSDSTINNVFSLYMNSIEGTMRVTVPEWAALVVLTLDVNGVRPVRVWNVAWTDDSDNVVTTSFNGQLKTLRTIDNNPGKLTLFYRIEADTVISVVVT